MIPKALVLNVIYAMHVKMKTTTIHCIGTHTHKLNYNYDEVFFPTNRQKCSVSVLCGFTSVHTGLMRP